MVDAEEALLDLQMRVDNAQHLANMGDYDWHIATDTNQWSDQLFRIYGYEPQEFNPNYERFLSFIHPDDQERIKAIHQAAYATGEPYEMMERIVRPDGEVRYLLVERPGRHRRDRHADPDARHLHRHHRPSAWPRQEREQHASRVQEERTRRRAALEINDNVVQGLTAALYALEIEDTAAVSATSAARSTPPGRRSPAW